jgi:hypothetical protein
LICPVTQMVTFDGGRSRGGTTIFGLCPLLVLTVPDSVGEGCGDRVKSLQGMDNHLPHLVS